MYGIYATIDGERKMLTSTNDSFMAELILDEAIMEGRLNPTVEIFDPPAHHYDSIFEGGDYPYT